MSWRNAFASDVLVREVNARWPDRDKSSDGTIGDAAHATRNSDHNPFIKVDGRGVVRARDIDKDGVDVGWLVEHLRKLGAADDPRLVGGGYLIWNHRITRPDFSGWKNYTGKNPHTGHAHISLSRNAFGFDSRAPWGITRAPVGAPPRAAPASGRPTLRLGSKGRAVQELQDWSNWYSWHPALPVLAEDGVFGADTERVARMMQGQLGVDPDGIVGGQTWRALVSRGFPVKR